MCNMQQLILSLGGINKRREANKSLVPMPVFPLNRKLTRNLSFGEENRKYKSSGERTLRLKRQGDEKENQSSGVKSIGGLRSMKRLSHKLEVLRKFDHRHCASQSFRWISETLSGHCHHQVPKLLPQFFWLRKKVDSRVDKIFI